MRVLIDVNILRSYLIGAKEPSGTIEGVMAATFDARFTIVATTEIFDEMVNVVEREAYFRERISPARLENFVRQLTETADIVPTIDSPVEIAVRDKKGDYLISAALFHDVDIVVTGDKDLLALRDVVTRFQIVRPRELLTMLGV